ncbi:MAG: hypothetical protein ACOX35_05685 [Bacillota bacterium]|nr:hypothetical protein [Candidatus Fermentithermobacillaceae bacterium]
MQSKARRGVIVTLVSAFVLEKALRSLQGPLWFTGVFLGVYIIAALCFRRDSAQLTAYFEDVFFKLAVCIGLGLLAWYADGQISIYTGKHGSPAIPAAVFALADRLTSETH